MVERTIKSDRFNQNVLFCSIVCKINTYLKWYIFIEFRKMCRKNFINRFHWNDVQIKYSKIFDYCNYLLSLKITSHTKDFFSFPSPEEGIIKTDKWRINVEELENGTPLPLTSCTLTSYFYSVFFFKWLRFLNRNDFETFTFVHLLCTMSTL